MAAGRRRNMQEQNEELRASRFLETLVAHSQASDAGVLARLKNQKMGAAMSLGVRIFLAITATLIGIVMVLHGTTAEEDKAWFSYAFGLLCILIAAAAFLKGRAAQFCGSAVGVCVFIGALWYLGYELMTGPIASAGEPSIIRACLFLLVFGIPGLLYAVKARFGLGKNEPAQ